MPELFLELFSEEIPARMQARAAEDLARLLGAALAPLAPTELRTTAGPRRIALGGRVNPGVADSRSSERGPRLTAPEQALAGFLRKHGANRDDLRQEGDFWVLDRAVPGVDAATLIAREIPGLLRRFPWPKSMRWGGSSRFTWVRPLRRILCILDGEIVHFDLRDGEDDGHGLASSNVTEGHRFMAPGAFAVASEAAWRDGLRDRYVIVDAAERRARIWDGVVAKAAERGLTVVPDEGLLDEVAGLVEWPVALLGRIEDAFMDLPPEVMQVSMRVNQRYFALRDGEGAAAPFFAFAANIAADDGGAAIVAGNERVLRARFSDARHFWDLDRTRTLESRVEDLRNVTFHAKIGTQYERALRLERIVGELGTDIAGNLHHARRAALLCKADLTTGMVGEFPELQGVMGGYYARSHEDRAVADAIREHYLPRGPDDRLPTALVSILVALADKLDQLVQFFRIGEKPTGSGDPYALRRAAIGIIRILQSKGADVPLAKLVEAAGGASVADEIVSFLKERLAVQLRAQGRRYDLVRAYFGGTETRVTYLVRGVDALAALIDTQEGVDLLAGYRRASNILPKDWPQGGEIEPSLFQDQSESVLADIFAMMRFNLDRAEHLHSVVEFIPELARFRGPLDAFFESATVNSPQPDLRRNRLNILSAVVSLMNRVADFSQIEG